MGPSYLRVHLSILGECNCKFIPRHPNSGIRHLDGETVISGELCTERYRPAIWRKFDRVTQQIQKNLFKKTFVSYQGPNCYPPSRR